MSLTYGTYKTRNILEKDLFNEIRREYFEADYKEDDKLQVVMHRIIDNFVSYISLNNLKLYLDFYSYSEQKTLDKDLLPERLNNPEKYDRCLLFCLIEQSLYNNNIQRIEVTK